MTLTTTVNDSSVMSSLHLTLAPFVTELINNLDTSGNSFGADILERVRVVESPSNVDTDHLGWKMI